MFFNNKAKYKNNFLAMAVPSTIAGYYKRYEFSIYDSLRQIGESKGALAEEDIVVEVRRLRELVANTLIDALAKEYKEASEDAKCIMKSLHDENYENMLEIGPKIACVYIVVAKCVLGEDGAEVKIDEVAEALLQQLEEMERRTIQNSIDILIEDGLLENNYQWRN